MAEDVAGLTLAHVRSVDRTLSGALEVLERHETRLGRIGRDLGELKSDQVLMENRMLGRINEILNLAGRADDRDR